MATEKANITHAGRLLRLKIGTELLKPAELAEEIGIPTRALTRFMRGHAIQGQYMLKLQVWFFEQEEAANG